MCIRSVEFKLLSITVCTTGKNNGFSFSDILGYLKNTNKNPKFGRVRQVPIRELGWEFPGTVLISNYPLNESFGLLQIQIQDFASSLLENFNCKVGVTTSLLTLSHAFDNYVHFNKRYSSKSLKNTKNYNYNGFGDFENISVFIKL